MPYLMFIGLPIILGTIADKFVLSDEQIGWIASADLSGLFLGSIVTSLLIRRVPLRRLALIGVAIGLIGNGLSSSADDLIQFCIIRFIADFGSGVCHALGLACLSRSKAPSRNFSAYLIVIVIIGSAWLFALPTLSANWGIPGIFWSMATAFVVLGLLLPRIKDQEASFPLTTNQTTTTQTNPKESSMALRLTPWICLVGLVFFNAGVTSHWTFSERLGASIGLSTYFISTTFTLCNLMTIVGYLFANRLTDRWGVYKPNFTVLFVLGSAILVSAGLLTKWAYVVAIFLFFQTWGMSTIFQLATLSTLDSTGRFIALSPAANGLGMTLGPALASLLMTYGMTLSGLIVVNSVIIFITLFAFVGVALITKGANRKSRIQPMIASAK